MSKYPNKQVWLVADDETPKQFDFCGGKVAVFSRSSPDKTTGNEDAAAVIELALDHGVLLIADGMGGANAGGRAAQCAIETIVGALLSANVSGETARSQILDSIENANKEILSWGLGAGLTLVAVEYLSGTCRTFHVGDATAFVCSNRGRIKSSTIAHAPVAMAVEAGMLNEDEALAHEDRHLIFNCVGSVQMKIELGPVVSMAARDTLVIGSDGLFDNLTMEEIVDHIRAGQLARQTELLVERIRSRMLTPDGFPSKPDDLTLICFRQ